MAAPGTPQRSKPPLPVEPVEEAKVSKKDGRKLKDWESENVTFLKQLNKREAMQKIADYWKNNKPMNKKRAPKSLLEELHPNYN